MEALFEKYKKKLAHVSLNFTRSLYAEIAWDARLIGIKGARGTGKTTMLLQHIKKTLSQNNSALYVSLDDIWFTENSLVALADNFVKYGGKYLFLDEVHKYPNWSQEIKNLYDDYPELQVVFTGSSLLEILNARADLSRRAITYSLQGLSFREYLNLMYETSFKMYTLEEILQSHEEISTEIVQDIKPLPFFKEYLKSGYYPFVRELPELYHDRLGEVINLIIDIELPLLRNVAISYIPKLKQLLLAVAESAPFIPNVSRLSERTGINRNTLVTYLHYLEEAGLTRHIYKVARGVTRMQKPDKLYLENTNIAYTLLGKEPNIGNMRETFFANQLAYQYSCTFPTKGDFIVNDSWLFEVGGKNKTTHQLKNWSLEKAFIAKDDIEFGYGQQIPLWQFGFLY
ncbi:MAG: AAA family ATPase [Bacteroidota bacterium]